MKIELTEGVFEDLYLTYGSRLLGMFRGLLRGEEYDIPSAAEGLLHDTFERAWKSRDTYDARRDAKPSTWLRVIAVNTFLDHCRKRRVRGFRMHVEATTFFEMNDGALTEQDIIAVEPSQEVDLIGAQRVELAEGILSKKCQAYYFVAFWMHEVEDASIEEVALRLGKPENTIKVAIFSGESSFKKKRLESPWIVRWRRLRRAPFLCSFISFDNFQQSAIL